MPIGDCAPGAEKARRWWLDGVGNWKQTEQRDQFNADSFDTRGVTSFNEYTAAAGATLDYDDNGNLMNDEKNLHYHWDAFNRLHRVTDASDATTATYTYDTDGRRLMKDLSGTTSDVSFAYDGWQIILEYAGAAGLPRRQYTYGAFINEPLFMDVADGNGEFLDEGDSSPLERYSYLQTPIYNVAALVDYDTQELVERYDYDPYGKYTLVVGDTRTELGESLVGNSMTFTGHWFDRETGMYWMRKRYYNCSIGSFRSRDPIGQISGMNTYAYTNDSPINCIDIFGLTDFKFTQPQKNWYRTTINQQPDTGAGYAGARMRSIAEQMDNAATALYLKYPDAAAMWNWWRGRTGGDYTLPVDRLLTEAPDSREAVKKEIFAAMNFVNTHNFITYKNRNSDQLKYQFYSTTQTEGSISKDFSANWYHAIHGFRTFSDGDVWLKKDYCTCMMNLTITIDDYYDFNNYQGGNVSGEYLGQKIIIKLNEFAPAGIARNFWAVGKITYVVEWDNRYPPPVKAIS